jgi:tetratricopeptide (TPR) repeat protein
VVTGANSLQENKDSDALRHFEQAVRKGNKDPQLYYDYAMLLRDRGAPLSAVLANLENAVSLDPKFYSAHYLLGYLNLSERNYTAAIAHLEKAAKLRPENIGVWECLAFAFRASGDRERAIQTVVRARSLFGSAADQERVNSLLQFVEAPLPGPSAPAIVAVNTADTALHALKSDARIEGEIAQVDCLGALARLRIVSNAGKTFLLVRDASAVLLKGAQAAKFEFACGPLERQFRVTAEYQTHADATYGTAGDLTSLEFK